MSDEMTEGKLKRLARNTADQVTVQSDNVLWRIAAFVPGLNRFVARRERALAEAHCAEMLRIVRTLQREDPALQGEPLYLKAITRRLGCGESKAREIVRLADQSFAQWPEERDVNLRDVVNYVIVNQIMTAHRSAMGTLVDMEAIVKTAIPAGL